jgi:hypothetical protein
MLAIMVALLSAIGSRCSITPSIGSAGRCHGAASIIRIVSA